MGHLLRTPPLHPRTGQVAGYHPHVVQVHVLRGRGHGVVVPEADIHVRVQRDIGVRRRGVQVQPVLRVAVHRVRVHREHLLPGRLHVGPQIHVQIAVHRAPPRLDPEVEVQVRLAGLAGQVHHHRRRLAAIACGRIEQQVRGAAVRRLVARRLDRPVAERLEHPVRRHRREALEVFNIQLRLRRRRRPDRRCEQHRRDVRVRTLPIGRVLVLVHRVARHVRDVRAHRQTVGAPKVLIGEAQRELRVPAAVESRHHHRRDLHALGRLEHHVGGREARYVERLVERQGDLVQRAGVVGQLRRTLLGHLRPDQVAGHYSHVVEIKVLRFGKRAASVPEADIHVGVQRDPGAGRRVVQVQPVLRIGLRRVRREQFVPGLPVGAQLDIKRPVPVIPAAPGPEVQVQVRLVGLAGQVQHHRRRLAFIAQGWIEHQVRGPAVRRLAGHCLDRPVAGRLEQPDRRRRRPALEVLNVQVRLGRRWRPDGRCERDRPLVGVFCLPVNRVGVLVHRIARQVGDIRPHCQTVGAPPGLIGEAQRELRVPAAAHRVDRHRGDLQALGRLNRHVVSRETRYVERLVERQRDLVQRAGIVGY